MLYVVPTPVGNLEDITMRAHRLLQQAQIIITEDSRQTRKLFSLLSIENKPKYIDILRGHQFNVDKITTALEQSLLVSDNGEELVVCVVSDGGTPGISDPGQKILLLAKEMQIPFTILPGPTALIPAVVASTLVTKEFCFYGFLPTKKGRKKELELISVSHMPVVLYESVHRIEKLLGELQELLEPDRQVFIAREISKKFENFVHTKAGELGTISLTMKGEFVIVIEAKSHA